MLKMKRSKKTYQKCREEYKDRCSNESLKNSTKENCATTHQVKTEKCSNGSRRSVKTGECETIKQVKTKKKRCPNGSQRSVKTGECEKAKIALELKECKKSKRTLKLKQLEKTKPALELKESEKTKKAPILKECEKISTPENPMYNIKKLVDRRVVAKQVANFNLLQQEFFLTAYGYKVAIRDRSKEICAVITVISPEELYLDNLYKCGEFSGTAVIHAVERFGRQYGYKTIGLEDESTIYGKFKKYRDKGGPCSIYIPIL